VVRCAATDHGRNTSRRMVLLEKWAHWRAAQAPEEARWPAAAELAPALVEEALGRLPGDEADLLRRKYCDGWSTQELAADLGTTPKAVENRLARLRGRLREIILHLR
jgi:RNA polymerase sigma factor (sigma-70 family)